MGREIYNEGRVVGYSAYEVYVRHALSVDPNTQPASELEWLSSSIAMGASMIVQIHRDSDTASGHHFQEIELPANTRLAAANTIIGSLFLGKVGELDSSGRWATKVTSYGPLIENNAEHPPVGSQDPQDWSTYPTIHDDIDTSEYQSSLEDYIKVVDGVVIQPGSWRESTSGEPPKDFYAPRFDGSPRVRILLSDGVSSPFNILLTGFTLGTVLKGVTGMDGSTNTSSPQDGDFLGPAVYPWANKIVFSVPPAYVHYYLDNNYVRTLNNIQSAVTRVPVIDMNTTDPATYYSSNYTSNPISFTVTKSNSVKGDAVLTVYQRNTILPPALYGTKVDAAGSYKLCPIDTTAPGTVKVFEGTNRKAEATAVNNIPGNVGMSRDNDYILYQSTQTAGTQIIESNPVADTTVDELQQERTGGTGPLALRTTTGKKSNLAVSLVDASGNELVRTGIHIPTFDSGNCFKQSGNLMVTVTEEPSNWKSTYFNYYRIFEDEKFRGDGTTTSFTFQHTEPENIAAVTVDVQGQGRASYIQNGWEYDIETKTLTLPSAPAANTIIWIYFYYESTFETINPIYNPAERFLKREGTLHWDDLMFALASNCAIDLFDNNYFLECVKSRLFPGSGISINEVTKTVDTKQVRGLEIVNTAQNIENGIGYTTLTQNVHFKSVGYNGFVTDTTAPPSQTHPALTVKILPSKSSRDYLYTSGGTSEIVQIPQSISIIVNGGSGSQKLQKFPYEAPAGGGEPAITKRGFYVGNYDSTQDVWTTKPGFYFYHDIGFNSTRGQYSWLFGVQFRAVGSIILVDGTRVNLTHIKAAIEDGTYKFQSTAKGSSGIWNVSIVGSNTSPRASWGALTNVKQGFTPGAIPTFMYHDEAIPSSGDTSLDSHIIATVASYEDGYNAQFDKYDGVVSSILGQEYQDSRGKMLWSNHINVSVSCMFYTD